MDWWREATLINQQAASSGGVKKKGKGLGGLPVELQDHVFGDVEDFPITLEDAKEIRLELMEERKHLMIRHGEAFVASEFSLCEH
jgi:predicted Rossmann-fold nucleotide-binding protein